VDSKTGEKLDKDLFRFDLGDIGEGYRKLLGKMQG
jgi:phosphoribosylaminoimidazole-succinocarboxamide synthase